MSAHGGLGTVGKRMAGRPTKLTPELTRAICELIESGDAPEVAAGVQGIGRSTFFEWQSRNDEFRTAVARAKDRCESEMRRRLLGGDEKGESFGKGKAALEYLGRRHPNRWSQRIKHEIDQANLISHEILKRVCSDPEVYAAVCAAEDCLPVLIRYLEELSRLDSEGDAAEDHSGASPVH
jgi:hypothetical protein